MDRISSVSVLSHARQDERAVWWVRVPRFYCGDQWYCTISLLIDNKLTTRRISMWYSSVRSEDCGIRWWESLMSPKYSFQASNDRSDHRIYGEWSLTPMIWSASNSSTRFSVLFIIHGCTKLLAILQTIIIRSANEDGDNHIENAQSSKIFASLRGKYWWIEGGYDRAIDWLRNKHYLRHWMELWRI